MNECVGVRAVCKCVVVVHLSVVSRTRKVRAEQVRSAAVHVSMGGRGHKRASTCEQHGRAVCAKVRKMSRAG